ncbi:MULTISPECIES: cytochrome P450 [unclassified Mycobacterium]|uniref:cytochrome P450 n=1 Tax=unclassified Mycobacterium TaxID=2642494 RepID=UPI0029C771BF|nr:MULTISPECIES: cytochrome P450 [unclassified Mycobacterium]
MSHDTEAKDFFRDDDLVEDPFPYFAELRNTCPVQREPHHGVVMVTGYDEAVQVLGDAQTYSSCTAVTGPFPGFPVPLEGDDVSDLIALHRNELPMSDQLPTLDPPTHTDHRSLLMQLITPKRLKENETAMWELVDAALDDYLTAGGGEFITGFAAPFTLMVIADLLGVPERDRAEFSERMAGGQQTDLGVGNTNDVAMQKDPLQWLYDRFTDYIAERRRAPRQDVLTGLATATFPDGSTPDVLDVAKVASNLYSAGQETTVRLLGAALQILAERPELQDLLRREPGRIPLFIEETLRMESPVKGDFRLSRIPTTIGSVDVPAGSTVMVLNAAANRDPSKFDDPDTFDVGRANARRHIAFGRGIHSCPGAPLARAEARVTVERLLQRTTAIRISEGHHGPPVARRFGHLPTFMMRGLTELHLEVVPVESATS